MIYFPLPLRSVLQHQCFPFFDDIEEVTLVTLGDNLSARMEKWVSVQIIYEDSHGSLQKTQNPGTHMVASFCNMVTSCCNMVTSCCNFILPVGYR
jgi:hypothetical protein